MPKYSIGVREVWVQIVEIEANSKEEALNIAEHSYGDYLNEYSGDYSHTCSRSEWDWDIEEINE